VCECLQQHVRHCQKQGKSGCHGSTPAQPVGGCKGGRVSRTKYVSAAYSVQLSQVACRCRSAAVLVSSIGGSVKSRVSQAVTNGLQHRLLLQNVRQSEQRQCGLAAYPVQESRVDSSTACDIKMCGRSHSMCGSVRSRVSQDVTSGLQNSL
jgi:hypothetical protein